MSVIDNWIEENKEELFKEIRKQRAELLKSCNEFPMTEYLKLVQYKNELDAIEYFLEKGADKYEY